jgi:homoserine kinase
MRFLTEPVRVCVPATSANLGPGFDALGLALTLHDEVEAVITDKPGARVIVRGEGENELPSDARHLVAATMLATFDQLGGRPVGFSVTCYNSIPHARGLGSSSAAIIAGVLLARALVVGGDRRLDDAAVIRLAARVEGHPDNVAPCQLGGVTIAWTEPGDPPQVRATRLSPAAGLAPRLFVPPHRFLTSAARAALPGTVPHADAAFGAARAALLVHALTTDLGMLFDATADRLHQSYRAAVMPDTTDLVDSLRQRGVPAVVSGAGPTVLGLLPEPDGESALVCHDLVPDGWTLLALDIATEGARMLSVRHAGGDPVAAGLPS